MSRGGRDEKREQGNAGELVDLTASIFRTVITGKAFSSLMELWDRSVSSRPSGAGVDAVIEKQLETALPLLEEAIRNMVTRDDLVQAVADDPRPCVLIDAGRTVIAVNEAGQRLFALAPGAALEERRIHEGDRKTFRSAIQSMDSAGPRDSGTMLRIQANDGFAHLALQPIRIAGTGETFARLSGIDLSVPEHTYDTMQKMFGLSKAQMATVRDLMDGMSGAEIARARDIREDTVKKQIRAIRDKTGASGRTALVSLVAGLTRIEGKVSAPPSASITNMANRVYTMAAGHRLLELGKQRIEYVRHGEPGGKAILHLHAAVSGFHLPPRLVKALNDAGYTVYTPFRPGYGLSEMPAGGREFGASVRQLAAFADAMRLERFSLLSSTSGSFFGYALQHLLGDRIIHHTAAAGYLPVDPDLLRSNMAPGHRVLMSAATYRPAVARFIALGAYKMLVQAGPIELLSRIYGRSEGDLRVVTNPAFREILTHNMAICSAQDVTAFISEIGMALAGPRYVPEPVAGPVTLVHGSQDPLLPARVARDYAARFANFDFHEIADGGQLLLYTHPVEVGKIIIDADAAASKGR